MRNILITGGTDGIGRGLALHYLKEGCRVFAVGSNAAKGQRLMEEVSAAGLPASSLTFLQADLSLISENSRVMETVAAEIASASAAAGENSAGLDGLILCAACLKPQPAYIETADGNEYTFSLYYLSRYILSHGLKELLEKAEAPFILNVAAPGMTGKVYWDDLQMKSCYDGQKAQFHGSRLNDLLAVNFTETDTVGKVHYVLFNPMAARTPGAAKMGEGSAIMKFTMGLYYKLMGKDVNEIVEIIVRDLNAALTGSSALSSFKLSEPVYLTSEAFNSNNAEKLAVYTASLL